MRRRLASLTLGLGLVAAACGRSARTPELTPTVTDGGCASDCEAGGTAPEGGALPDSFAGTGGQAFAGTFSMAGSVSSSAGAGDAPVVPITCVPASLLCVGRDLYTCNGLGTSATLTQACGDSAHCRTLYPGDCLCVFDDCVPGSTACDGNVVKTCNDDGVFSPKGTDCADMACDGGACVPKICNPRTAGVCRNGDVHVCLGQGATTMLARTCVAGTTCRGEPPTLNCVPFPCLPNSDACIDNQVGQCDQDGNALSVVNEDCAAKGDVCDSAGACSPSAVDDMGGATHTVEGAFAGNFIDVHSSRYLAKLQVNLRPVSGDVSVHWEVTRIDQFIAVEVVAMADSVAHPGDTTASTTALSCTLEAGQRYELVAYLDPPADVDFDVLQALPVASFGTVSWVADNHTQQIYAMRVTTTLP